MATEVILPRVDMDMAEGKVAHWYVKDGDLVRKGQVLFEIETDKATMEVDATADGVMHGIRGEIGVTMPVGEVLGWILAPGEAPPAVAGRAAAKEVPPAEDAAEGSASDAPDVGPQAMMAPPSGTAAANAAAVLRATPLARSLARLHSVDLRQVPGSGPGGRVVANDVQARLAAPASTLDPTAEARLHLHWARRGSGKPLLLIHGFGADQGSWRPLIQHLPATLAVLAVDLPGHGKSAPQAVRSLQDLAAAVRTRLDAEGITSFHALGHSLGGAVAIVLADALPQRVASLTLLAPAGLGPEIDGDFIDGLVAADDETLLAGAMTALFDDPSHLTGSFIATAFQQLRSPERRLALAAMAGQLMPRGRQSQNLRALLDGLQMPVQVVWGTKDRIIPMQHALGLPPHIGVHLLPATGHLPQVEAVGTVAGLFQLQSSVEQAKAA